MKQRIVTVMLAIFLVNLIITLTPNVIIFEAASAHAEDLSQRNYAGETQEASRDARENVSGTWSSITGFFSKMATGIGNAIDRLVAGVNGVFGFEKGEGPQAIFGGTFYVFLILVFLFVGKFLFNIVRDSVKGLAGAGPGNDARYRKPSFRDEGEE